ncbi:hypothetical protein [Neobacillus ginsengisoli]|uniref:Histidine kinase N-terminal 7TM region domain-containing protein n=1 Tax=Neobacillus ginsengisoli TaxID=904295 RepID=A0ABT9Y1C8_9BACI|nr:hypothetical protein [Neobacillus ginsengisoli]MDQ0201551.1 hypothetical protein [Neobacillus ginsengisoli]
MGFAVFFFLSWLIVAIFIVMQKRLSIVENTFVFLILLIVTINVSWIAGDELKLIIRTKSSMNYTAYLLNRSIIMPMVLITQLNMLQRCKTVTMKILNIVSAVIIMLGLSVLSNIFNIEKYTKWNYGYDVVYFVILLLIAYSSYKAIRKASQNVVEYS